MFLGVFLSQGHHCLDKIRKTGYFKIEIICRTEFDRLFDYKIKPVWNRPLIFCIYLDVPWSFQTGHLWLITTFLLNSYSQIKNLSDGRDRTKKKIVKSKHILRTFSRVSVPKKVCMLMQIFVKISKTQSITNFRLSSSQYLLLSTRR